MSPRAAENGSALYGSFIPWWAPLISQQGTFSFIQHGCTGKQTGSTSVGFLVFLRRWFLLSLQFSGCIISDSQAELQSKHLVLFFPSFTISRKASLIKITHIQTNWIYLDSLHSFCLGLKQLFVSDASFWTTVSVCWFSLRSIRFINSYGSESDQGWEYVSNIFL